ncbi:MAG: T9SS type A sorting domain-containing protein, partial [Legionellales bacterium]
AQCSMAGRYNTYVFPTYDMSTVSYSSTISADSMDIYQPHGDTFSARPLIIMAHGGSFYQGSRSLTSAATDVCVDTFCLRFVRRGYVTVSIDYRLAAGGLVQMVTAGSGAGSAADEVAKAISDGKAAIRYLVQHAATYKIDTNKIFIGGNSAGAVLYMHVGYLDSVGECTPLMLAALNNNGGFDGNSGNPGYTTKAKGVINMAGALASVSIASPGDIPSVNCQGDQDNVVPYTCGKPLGGACPDTLCGLGSLTGQYNIVHIIHWDHVFIGQQHVPWDGNTAMMNTVDSLTNAFLYSLVCPVTSVNEIHTNTEVNLYPNPASEVLNMNSTESISGIIMYDQMGRTVLQADGINKGSYEINTSRLAKGLYFIRIRFNNENNSPVVKRVAIQ